jgi:hypothetical protein
MVLAGMPVGYELDFDVLPAADSLPAYEFTVVIGVAGHADIELRSRVNGGGPANVAENFDYSDMPAWRMKRVGNRITLYACGDYRVTKVTVSGDGPRPGIRRVWPTPPEKKK